MRAKFSLLLRFAACLPPYACGRLLDVRELSEMVAPLIATAMADPERHGNAWARHEDAQQIARQLPLVHRTCKPGSEHEIGELMRLRRLIARHPCTGTREVTAGIPRALYFFLGCGAYPEGVIGFVFHPKAVLSGPASYTPLDSGSLENHASPSDPSRPWDDAAKQQFLDDHLGRGQEVAEFAAPYLATHFRQPMHYVEREQKSEPDFAAYHGLVNSEGDRRAYTIEVQAHDDVPLDLDESSLLELVVARESLLAEIPRDMIGRARIASAENEVRAGIAEGISRRMTKGTP